MAIAVKQPATTGSEGYGLWMITDPTSGASGNTLEAVRRVQSFNVSADAGDTPVFEIGNEGIVEYKSGIQAVSISFTGNQVAKTIDSSNNVEGLQWLALISNNVPSGSSREKDFSIGDPMTQHYNNDSGSIYPLDVDDFDELISSPGNTSSVVQGISTDILLPIKRGEDLDRVFTISQAYTNSIDLTFPVEGMATYAVSMDSDNFIFYQDTYKDVDIESYVSSTAGSTLTVTSNSTVYDVSLNGEVLTQAGDASELTDTSSRKWLRTSATVISFTSNLLNAGDKIRVRMQPSSNPPVWSGGSGINYNLTSDPGDQGAIQRQDVEAYLITNTNTGRVVEGFQVTSVNAGITYVDPGLAYIVSSSTGDLDFYRYDTVDGLNIAAGVVTSVAGDMWRVVALTTNTSGVIQSSVYDDSAGIPDNGVVLSTVNALSGVINSFQDARAWNRVGLSLVQNLTVSAPLTRKAVYQLGYQNAVERSLTKPLSITSNISAMDADAELIHILTGNVYDSDNVAAAQKEIKLNEMSATVGVQVNLFNSGSTHTDTTKKIVIEALDCKAGNISLSPAVQSDAEISFTLNGDKLRLHEVA